ncbi:sulfite exporter TauE/SafE family protein [Methyloprofundus sp.]|uniref:urease accessory protein UreH domain-containing protein n=1 Tax=Methyloprofundus sp. TaxID=2020875 RepID=UPI003D1004B3
MQTNKLIDINGMVCGGCETVIEEALAAMDGVLEVKADYTSGKCTVSFTDNIVELEDIYKTIEDKVYQVDLAPANKGNVFIKISLSILALIGIVLLMFFSRKLWHQFSVPEISSQLSYGMIFIVGLITGLHCIGMCGSFVIGYTVKDAEHGRSAYLSHLLYGIGKTLSYAMFGAVFGFIGSVVSITPFISGVSILLAGIFLIIFGLNTLGIFAVLKRVRIKQPEAMARYANNKRRNSRSPFFIGFFSGFLLGCGPLQAMYIMAAGNGDPLEGAKFLAAFGLGTLPALLGFGMATRWLSGAMTHRITQISGVILLVMGTMMLNKGLMKTQSGYDFKSISTQMTQQLNDK